MKPIHVKQWALIDLPPLTAYNILADYQDGHRWILPENVFFSYEVESGGRGEGTRIRFGMRAGGVVRTVRAEIHEPERGRVLTETDAETGAITTFTVEPVLDGSRCRVTIETTWTPRGLAGVFERLFAPRTLRRIYAVELDRLNRSGWVAG